MSLINFLKEAGEKVFGPKDANSSLTTSIPDLHTLNETAGEAIEKLIKSKSLSALGLYVDYDGTTETVTLRGQAPDQATREKIVLCAGNVQHVAQVRDEMTVASGGAVTQPEFATFHTVKIGDTLSKIAKDVYGEPNAYNTIFEANRPLITDPNKIYPGQVLRIPSLNSNSSNNIKTA